MFSEHYFDKNHNIHDISTVHVDATNNPHWEFPLHTHKNKLELSLIVQGEANIYCNGRMFRTGKKDILIKNRGVLHGERSVPENPIIQLCLSVSGVHFLNHEENVMIPEHLPPLIHLEENYELIYEMMQFIFKYGSDMKKTFLVNSMINQLLIVLFEEIASIDPISHTQDKLPQTIINVISYLDEHFMEKISLDDLAEMFYISPYYLSRKFKEFTGFPINQYVINRRMGEAERMLIFEDLSIKEIACQCGYTDLQYFYKTFKKYTGLTPVEFQEKYI